jgi:SCY1-like protein 1
MTFTVYSLHPCDGTELIGYQNNHLTAVCLILILSNTVATSAKSHQLKAPKSEDDPLWGPIAAAPPKSASKSADIKPSHNDEDDLWGTIAAPAPKSSGKPLKTAAANSDDIWGSIAAPAPSTKARPLASSGRGRGTKPAQPKLGAQRIGRTSSTGM